MVWGRLLLLVGVVVVAGCSSPGGVPVSSGRTALSELSATVDVVVGELVPPGTPDPTAARALLGFLPVQEFPVNVPGFDAARFGGWADPDGNGCDGRGDALAMWWAASGWLAAGDTCRGALAAITEPYSGAVVGEADVALDRVVSLASAWVAGASAWSDERRVLFANDPSNLVPTTAEMVAEKGSAGVADWLPLRVEYWCSYASIAVGTRSAYGLSVTPQELQALGMALDSCISVSPESVSP